ncbi:Na+/H+ antiporter subunit E [Marinobacter panjinensis]|uniref:Na+/H+ antiporter subunit E n=1 Tax=Marinobacter panjinensis TaxID=2576384 RepID=A0A4U6R8T3_9GAMM|nr:Na+/H+ antiporter subunit E [Marinobacter panjinensis]MCR8914398.1 Na+/H+ antiporter subunit E [Marinobacter panjinensis]TKV68766.1 Na+/H+ antiporter subunit E [Marinobacter panjinensis]
MNRREFWLPRPLFSLFLALLWLLMVNSFSVAHMLLGLALGVFIPFVTRSFWPEQAKVRYLLPLLRYFLVLMVDIVRSNLIVAKRILWYPNQLTPGFVIFPLELDDDFAITILASTISLTPGTVTAHYDSDAGTLLIHALHVTDEDELVRQIKDQYERPLKEIFQ